MNELKIKMPTFSSKFLALFLSGLCLLMTIGVVHGLCPDTDGHEDTEHVLICKCTCHNDLLLQEIDPVLIIHVGDEVDPVPQSVGFIPDGVLFDVFRPPQRLV
jgi:hypothetical protein